MTDAITIHNPRNRGGSTGHVLAKRSVTFTEIRNLSKGCKAFFFDSGSCMPSQGNIHFPEKARYGARLRVRFIDIRALQAALKL